MERYVDLSLLSVRTEVSDWLMYHECVTLNFSIIRRQFVSEMFDFSQQDSARGALQYELTIVVNMMKYWVPDPRDIKDFSDHFKHSMLIFADGTSSA